MALSCRFSGRSGRKTKLSRMGRQTLSLVAEEEGKGSISSAEADALEKYAMALLLSEYLRASTETQIGELLAYSNTRFRRTVRNLMLHAWETALE